MSLAFSYSIIFLIGCIAAIFGSIVGLGGGVIIVPAMIYLYPHLTGDAMTSTIAVGTSAVVLVFTALTSTLNYARSKRIDYRSGATFFAASGPAAIVGAMVTSVLEGKLFDIVFGLFLLAMGLLLLFRDRLQRMQTTVGAGANAAHAADTAAGREGAGRRAIGRATVSAGKNAFVREHGQAHNKVSVHHVQNKVPVYEYKVVQGILIGLAVGFISGLLGIGGGAFFVPLMVILFRFPPHAATATSMFVILLSAIFGSFTHIYLNHVDYFALSALAPGALLGGWLGATIAGRLSGRRLLALLVITVLAMAVQLIWQGIA